MAKSDAAGGRPVLRFLGFFLCLSLIAGITAVWRYDLIDRYFDDDPVDTDDPALIAAPPGLELPALTPPPAVARPGKARGPLSTSAIESALAPHLSDKDLGKHVLAAVAPLGGGPTAYTFGSGMAIPASTTKVVTSAAALFALGAEHRFATTVVPAGRNRIVLVGGGDPFLEPAPEGELASYPVRADLMTLAQRTAKALKKQGVRRVQLSYDESLFTGPAVNPRWRPEYLLDSVSPTSALWVNEGHSLSGYGRDSDPAATAAGAFASALAEAGVQVNGSPTAGSAADGARPIAAVQSAPLADIVERILNVSDNDAAEVLLRHIGIAQASDGSIESGRQGVMQILSANGVEMGSNVLYDGSGLSRDNQLNPQLLIDVLRVTARPGAADLRPVLTGLPVAGFTGSLTDRMSLSGDAPGRGRVRAKTGTLSNVTSLAGYAVDLDGNPMVFVLMADKVKDIKEGLARVAQDSAAAALGACHCGG